MSFPECQCNRYPKTYKDCSHYFNIPRKSLRKKGKAASQEQKLCNKNNETQIISLVEKKEEEKINLTKSATSSESSEEEVFSQESGYSESDEECCVGCGEHYCETKETDDWIQCLY
ncbi:hypothetical protein HHI36_003434, partial [Cryptolaemus montrouzieri]